MQSLEEVIRTIRREVGTALAAHEPLPAGVTLDADRVVVTLQFDIEQNSPTSPVALNFDRSANSTKHSLQIEFKCSSAGNHPTPPAAILHSKPEATELKGPAAESVIQQLSTIFGAPGFDSSARATVFREAFQELSDQEVEALIKSLSVSPSASAPNTVKHSLSLVERVCRAGPSGIEKGKRTLAQIFASQHPTPVLKLIATTWKTQEEWMG